MALNYVCPVCGDATLGAPPYFAGRPSYVICDCCGTEFGLDDAAVETEGASVYKRLRGAWITEGAPWHVGPPPQEWRWQD